MLVGLLPYFDFTFLNANAEQQDCITCRQSEISHFCSGARPTAQRQPAVGGMGRS